MYDPKKFKAKGRLVADLTLEECQQQLCSAIRSIGMLQMRVQGLEIQLANVKHSPSDAFRDAVDTMFDTKPKPSKGPWRWPHG